MSSILRKALSAALAREGHELVDCSAMTDMESTPERYVIFLERTLLAEGSDEPPSFVP